MRLVLFVFVIVLVTGCWGMFGGDGSEMPSRVRVVEKEVPFEVPVPDHTGQVIMGFVIFGLLVVIGMMVKRGPIVVETKSATVYQLSDYSGLSQQELERAKGEAERRLSLIMEKRQQFVDAKHRIEG